MPSSKQSSRRSGRSKRGPIETITRPSIAVRPPQIENNLTITRTFRFKADAAVASMPITNFDMLKYMSVGTVTNTTVSAMFRAVKLHRVRLWVATTGAEASFASISFYNSNDNSAAREFGDTSLAGTNPAYVECRPPVGSTAWLVQGSNTSVSMFTVSTSHDAILDIHASFVVRDGASVVTSTVATAVIGTVYYMGADTSGSFVPVGLNTTT